MIYMVHTCPKRLWYVVDFLIPDMIKQGIKKEDIVIWKDSKKWGNLTAFVKSAEYIRDNMPTNEGTWHLQDDICLSDSFAEKSLDVDDMIVNAFVSKRANPNKYIYTGKRMTKRFWWSFPCMYIPNRYMAEFVSWYYNDAMKDEYYKSVIDQNKGDDWLFWSFMKLWHRTDYIMQLFPNLADHVDFLVGGSVTNEQREGQSRAEYFEDQAKVEALGSAIAEYQEKKKAEQHAKRTERRQKAVETKKTNNSTTKAKKPVKTQNGEVNE